MKPPAPGGAPCLSCRPGASPAHPRSGSPRGRPKPPRSGTWLAPLEIPHDVLDVPEAVGQREAQQRLPCGPAQREFVEVGVAPALQRQGPWGYLHVEQPPRRLPEDEVRVAARGRLPRQEPPACLRSGISR